MDHDIQEGILNFPFDHLYACHTEHVDVVSDNVLHSVENDQAQNEIMQLTSKLNNSQRENCKLKDLVLINLDLLQQQSDEIIQKDKEIALYQQEITKLKLLVNQVDSGSLNLRLQSLNPPPLIHLTTPGQPVSTVTILPESATQVQYTNITGIIKTSNIVDNVIAKKSSDKKLDCIETYAVSEVLPCTNVGSLIDTRYLQCTDSVFETQPSICIQNLVQPVIQSKIQPIIQTSIHSVSQTPVTVIQSTNANSLRFKNILMNKIPNFKTTLPNIYDNDKRPKNTEYVITKEPVSKLGDSHFLTLNKKCKTIFTYEKSCKKNVKKIIKTINPPPNFELNNKLLKNKDQLHSYSPITIGKSHTGNFLLKNSMINDKYPKYSTFANSEFSSKSDHEYLGSESVPQKVIPIKVIPANEVKSTQQRRFFTSSLKEKVSCRDFSYGESLGNIKYDVKTDILEYLEGNNSNSQTDIDIIDTNLDNDLYNINNMSPRSESPIDIDKKIGIRQALDGSIILQDEMLDKIIESRTNPTPSYRYINTVKKYYLDSQYDKMSKTNKKRTTSTMSSQSNESPTHNPPQQSSSKITTAKKQNVRRKRALSSASKVSTVSQTESPAVPYSWSFSGQDFKILMDDIKSTYHMPIFGSNQSYFSAMQVNSKEDETPNEAISLEVPSWRIKNYTPDEYVHTTENVDEESYLKRHLKMEAEEKRRKRWDFQMIREQRHIEKLKQRQERRNSGGFKPSRNSKVVCNNFPEEEPSSFYPSPDDLFSIEIRDSLPVSAFGECIPDLPSRPFQLPWIRSRSHHSHSRGHASKKKSKLTKSEGE